MQDPGLDLEIFSDSSRNLEENFTQTGFLAQNPAN